LARAGAADRVGTVMESECLTDHMKALNSYLVILGEAQSRMASRARSLEFGAKLRLSWSCAFAGDFRPRVRLGIEFLLVVVNLNRTFD